MQLREAHALGVLDDHQRRIGNVDSHFDDRRRHQQLDLAVFEAAHGEFLGWRRHAAVNQSNAQVRQGRRQCGGGLLRRLVWHLLGFVDQRADPICLSPCEAGGANSHHHFVAAQVRQHHGLTGVRPGGNSSMTDTSRSAYAVIASVRGMGVAVMIN